MESAELAFAKRNLDAAYYIEPLDEVVKDVISLMKEKHLQRMAAGHCDPLVDADFTNVLGDMTRISALCSNVGEAVVIRVRPELAEHEHDYFAELHSGRNENFNKAYNQAYSDYMGQLSRIAMPEEDSKITETAGKE